MFNAAAAESPSGKRNLVSCWPARQSRAASTVALRPLSVIECPLRLSVGRMGSNRCGLCCPFWPLRRNNRRAPTLNVVGEIWLKFGLHIRSPSPILGIHRGYLTTILTTTAMTSDESLRTLMERLNTKKHIMARHNIDMP